MLQPRQLFEIWEEPNPRAYELPWRAMMSGYVAQFPTKEAAEKYIALIKKGS